MKISSIAIAVALGVGVCVSCAAGNGSETASGENAGSIASGKKETLVPSGAKESPTDATASTKGVIESSADSLYMFVADQVAFGPRTPGSKAHAACHDYIVRRLQSYGAAVSTQDTVVATVEGKRMPVRNIIGVINGDAPRRVLLLAHYDTRPWADAEPDTSLHDKAIDGANDGGSGVAVLLEIVRLSDRLPADLGVELLFADAEDSGTEANDETWCIGSQVWADRLTPADSKIAYGILLDMVGGVDATFPREYFSEYAARPLNTHIRRSAARLGHSARFPEAVGGAINDDHLPVLRAGIPCIDIIEISHPQTGSFNPTWHTLADNLQNIDPATMKIVTDVVIDAITH